MTYLTCYYFGLAKISLLVYLAHEGTEVFLYLRGNLKPTSVDNPREFLPFLSLQKLI